MTTTTVAPILHVLIEDETGVVADIDASSTADALAYFLTSRHVDAHATAGAIGLDVQMRTGRKLGRRQTVVFESRHPITGVLEAQYRARLKGDQPELGGAR